VAADAAGARVTHRIRIRMREGLTTRHRFRDGARVWRIASLREEDASARFLLIDAEEWRD
jgi:head-tail adaptor